MANNNAWNSVVPAAVSSGGTGTTGAGGLVKYGVLLGEGTNAISQVAATTAGYALVGSTGADPSFIVPSESGLTLTTNSTTLQYTLPTPITVANGGTDDSSFTAYTVLCGGTTSTAALQNVSSVGTAGYMLTSQGASALPQFAAATAAMGSLALIQTQTASSSASLNFTYGITALTPNYLVIISNIQPSTGTPTFQMNFSTNNGGSWLSSNYTSGANTVPYNSSTFTNINSTSTCPLGASSGESTSTYYSGVMWLFNLATANPPSYNSIFLSGTDTGGYGFGSNSTTSGVNALQFIMSSGNISSGSISLYQILV